VTLITGTTAVGVGNEIYAYSPLIDFAAAGFSSGDERIALDFTSPNDHYSCVLNVSLDTGSWSAADIIAIIFRGNGETLFKAKWGVNATTIGQPQSIYPLQVILPPNTIFKAVLAFSSATAMVGSGSVVLVGKQIGGSLG